MVFHELLATLDQFWLEQGCVIAPPQDTEAGAGTFYPTTFLRVLGSEPWCVAGIAPSRRPTDGRYGQNPYRFQYFYQYQVVLKPSPDDVQNVYLRSLEAIGIDTSKHDIRFVEDNWESPTLGAWGLGWEVWLDGMEITQFTYFQQVGGYDCKPVSVELTYGLERLALYLQGKAHTWDIDVAPGVTMGDFRGQFEEEHSRYNFEEVNVDLQRTLFDRFADEAERLFAKELVYPGYEFVIKCSHAFNLLDARGVLSHAERQAYVQRVRRLAAAAATAQLNKLGELPAEEEA